MHSLLDADHQRWGRRCLAFGAALVLLALPVDVDAKPGYRVHPGGIELILPVENRGGRVIAVLADNRQHVRLRVEESSSGIEYSIKGRVSGHRIEADYGALGRIDVRLQFARYGPGVLRRPHCKGRDPIEAEGTYRGMIELSGADGIAEVAVKRGHFYFERHFRQVCKRQPPTFKPGLYPKLRRKSEEGVLAVRGKGEGRTVRLDAIIFALRRNPARAAGALRAEVHERREAVRVTRWTGGSFDPDSFVMSKRGKEPETLEVEPPEPFAGSALFSRNPGSPSSWTGDLSVDLPGAEEIPLTGAGFYAVLCRGSINSFL
jgi:hypothetical protein